MSIFWWKKECKECDVLKQVIKMHVADNMLLNERNRKLKQEIADLKKKLEGQA